MLNFNANAVDSNQQASQNKHNLLFLDVSRFTLSILSRNEKLWQHGEAEANSPTCGAKVKNAAQSKTSIKHISQYSKISFKYKTI